MPLAATVTFTFKDAKGKSSTTAIKLPLSLSIVQYVEAAQKLATILVGNTLALLTQVKVCIGLDVVSSAPGAASDVQEVGQFQFACANETDLTVFVPTLDEAKVGAGTDALLLSDLDIQAFRDIYLTGDGVIQPINVRNQDVSSLKYAREMFRRR